MPDPTLSQSDATDRAGRRRSPATFSEFHQGRSPRNKGKRYRPDPPTETEILRAIAATSDDALGTRLRALIVVLWRAGLTIGEALTLRTVDLHPVTKKVAVEWGRIPRQAEMDGWGFDRVNEWLEYRRKLPGELLLCVVAGPTAGDQWAPSQARAQLHALGARAGISRRFAPQQLRHAHARDLLAHGAAMGVVERQLGLSGRTRLLEGTPQTGSLPALPPPGVVKKLKRDPSSPGAATYSAVRQAAQAADAAHRAAPDRWNKRAWSEAITALHAAEDAIVRAIGSEYGEAKSA